MPDGYIPGEEYGLPQPPSVLPKPERPKRDEPEDWLSSRMARIRRAAMGEWRMRGEIEPWETYFRAKFPDVAAYYAKRQYEKYGAEEEWGTWFARRYPSLAKQYGWPEYKEPTAIPKRLLEPEGKEESWVDWLRRAGRFAPRIKTVEF